MRHRDRRDIQRDVGEQERRDPYAIQSLGNVVASSVAGLLCTLVSPGVAFVGLRLGGGLDDRFARRMYQVPAFC